MAPEICPVPKQLLRWWRRRSATNMAMAASEGRPLRDRIMMVTEEQVNRRFKLAPKEFKPGQVAERLEACGYSLVQRTIDGQLHIGVRRADGRGKAAHLTKT